MRDEEKSKEELVTELRELRKQLATLEKKQAGDKQTEELLKEHADHFKLLYEEAPLPYQSLDESGNFIAVNDAWLKILGYTKEEVMERNFGDFLHPEWIDHFKENFPRFKAIGEVLGVEFEMIKKDGSTILVSFHGRIGRNSRGRFRQTHCIFQNITEHRQAEEALRTSEERFSKAFQQAPLLMTISRVEDGAYIDVNDKFVEVSGFSREEAIGKTSTELGWISSEDRKRLIELLKAQGRLTEMEITLHGKDNREITCLYNGELIITQGRQQLLSIAQDITHRKQVEQALLESENKFRSFAEHAFVGVYLIQDEVFKYVNPKFAEMFGYTVEECLNDMPFKDLVYPEDLNKVAEQVRKRISGEVEFVQYTFRGLKKHGEIFHIEIYGSSTLYKGKPAATGTMLDITERNKAEVERDKSERRYRELFENIHVGVAVYEVKGDGLDFVFKDFNRAGERIDKEDRERLIGKSIFEVRPGIEQFGLIDVFKRVWRTGEAAYHPVTLYQDQWLGGWYENFVYKLPSGEIVAVFEDVTERKKMEGALKESAERLDLATRAASLGIWDWDIQDNKLIWNDQMYELYGVKEEEYPGAYEAWLSGVHPDDRARCDEESKQARLGERDYNTEFRIVWPNGSVRVIKAYGRVMRDAAGNPLRMTGINYDMTELKRSEAARREMQLRTEAILAGIADTFYSLDDQWRFTIVNPAAEKAPFGRTAAELLGRVIWELYPDLVGTSIHQHYLNASRNYTLEHYVALSPLNGLWYEVFMQGWKGGVDVYMRDVTDRKRSEEELRHKTALLEAQANSTIDGILVVDSQGKKIFQNRRTIDLWKIPQHIAESDDDMAQVQHVMHATKYPEQFFEKVAYLYSHPNENSRDEIELTDGTVLDRYSAPVLGENGQHYGRIWTFRDITERKRAEMELLNEKQFAEKLLESLPGIFFLYDSTCHLKRWNKAHETAMGFTADELRDWYIPNWHKTPEDAAVGMALVKSVLETGVVGAFETTLINKEGLFVPYLISITRLMTPGGPAMMGVGIDITERKRAEEAVARERTFSEDIINSLPGIFYMYDDTGKLVRWNRQHEEATGYSSEEMLGMYVHDWFAEEHKPYILSRFQSVFAQGESFAEAQLQTKDGSQVPYYFTGRLATLDGKRYLIGVGVDISERKRSEEERTLLATAVEQAEENVFVTDHRRTILYINPAFERSSGYRLEDLKGKKLRTLRSARHDEAFYRNMKEVLDRGEVWMGVIINKGKDGSDFEIEATISPIRDASGAITHLVGAGRNMSPFRKLERELQQAQKMESVGRLAGGVAHDFNNMLGVIIGHAELAQMRIDSAQPAYTHLQEIQKAAHRSANLVHQLLAFARKQTISPKVLDINETVESMLKMVRRLIGEDIELLWKPSVGVWPVKVDPTQIDQILANMCVNARDAIAGVGRVMVETRNVSFDVTYDFEDAEVPPGDYVLLAVNDTGSGMEKHVLDKLFEPFFTTKEMGKGTGLGLAMVYGIVKQNNGFIEVQSEPGRGTTFRIYLPRTDQLASEEHPSQHQRKNLAGTETILLVEDEDSLLELGKTTLEYHGYLVLAARGPLEALDLAKSHSGAIDLLLTDVIMPAMTGRELAERLSAFKPGLRFMFMSGYPSEVIAQHGVLDEGVHFLQKPFSVKSMVEKIREVLDT